MIRSHSGLSPPRYVPCPAHQKKPAHKCVPTSRKRIDLSLLQWWLHIHVTGFEIQSRNCPLRFSDCRQLKAIQKRRYFPLAYRWRCPAESRHPKSVKNVIQLSLSNEIVLLYQIEQVFVKAFRVFCGCAEKRPVVSFHRAHGYIWIYLLYFLLRL